MKQEKVSENKEEFINKSKENDNSNASEYTNNELDKGNVELQTHTVMNKNKKSLICTECGLRCRNNKSLTVHIRRHTGEKHFNCKFCSKAFPRVDDLRLHEK